MLAQSAYRREEKAEYLKEYEEIYEQIMAKRQCLSIKELAVTGTDLIADGMQPGKASRRDAETAFGVCAGTPGGQHERKINGTGS